VPIWFVCACAPIVVTCHGSDCTIPYTNPYFRPFVRHTLNKADRVVAVSDFRKGCRPTGRSS
jgi:hypothetical protein